MIDDYGDDEEFAWCSHWLGISVLNRRSNPIGGGDDVIDDYGDGDDDDDDDDDGALAGH